MSKKCIKMEDKNMAKFEYLLIKRNGNKDGLVYDKRVFTNSQEARKDFRVNDIILKCKEDSIYRDDELGWTVKSEDVIERYYK
jgi:hypothetical protein